MKRFIFIAWTALLFFGTSFAQSVTEGVATPDDWGGFWVTQGSLVALVLIVVAFVKERFALAGSSVVIMSLGVGAALGAFGKLMTFYTGDWPSAILFGLGAGFMASGGWDAVAGLQLKSRDLKIEPVRVDKKGLK